MQSLQSASQTASNWLGKTGDNISRNLDEARRIEGTIHGTSSGLEETREHTWKATEARIRTLQEKRTYNASSLPWSPLSKPFAVPKTSRNSTRMNVHCGTSHNLDLS